MQKQVAVNNTGASLAFSERWEVDYLCNRYGLSRSTARNIVRSYFGDQDRIAQEAQRLGKYERLH
jgi:hypothetical protein